MKIPEGYQQVMPYLILNDAEGFMKFMQQIFGAKEKMKVMRDEKTIMHAEMFVGDCTIMFAQATDQFKEQHGGFFIYVDDADKSYEAALAAGATSVMPPSDQEYGRSGGVKDPFGNTWWVTTDN